MHPNSGRGVALGLEMKNYVPVLGVTSNVVAL